MFRKFYEFFLYWLYKPACWWVRLVRLITGKPPSVSCWLKSHPNVADSIKWQFQFQGSAYDIPDSAKIKYTNWSQAEKNELQAAFDAAWNWYKTQAGVFSAAGEGLAYPPVNQNDTSNNSGSPWTKATEAWAREFYIRWIAFALVIEIGNKVPWSVTTFNAEQLQVLFDSAAIMTRPSGGGFTLVSGNPGHTNYVKRKDNLGSSMPAPPWYTYAFLINNAIIGATRYETIGNLLQWISDNCAHYYGFFNYQETENHWQYRGNPPITRIIEGTTNPTLGAGGTFKHWTAGCHGTTGLIRNVLRAVNIPVHISTVCGHSHACFTTEGLYLDHGDNPYNSTFKGTGQPASALLIDDATYIAWFGASTDNREEGCDKIGHQVNVLAGG